MKVQATYEAKNVCKKQTFFVQNLTWTPPIFVVNISNSGFIQTLFPFRIAGNLNYAGK